MYDSSLCSHENKTAEAWVNSVRAIFLCDNTAYYYVCILSLSTYVVRNAISARKYVRAVREGETAASSGFRHT